MEPVHLPRTKDKKIQCPKKEEMKDNIISLESLRAIISLSSSKNQMEKSDLKKWVEVLSNFLEILCLNEEVGNESIPLVSHAYLSLRRAVSCIHQKDFEDLLRNYVRLKKGQLIDFHRVYYIKNLELFKLMICSGFLQLGVNSCSFDLFHEVFDILYPHCIRYTQYTYFAFKLLEKWMQRVCKANLWSMSDSLEVEQQLEAILFSNWDNTISKANVLSIFGLYLRTTKEKYNDYISYLFYSCVERISWCHVTKYMILAEICSVIEDFTLLTESKFVSNLFNSLSVNNLSNASSKVYLIICNKLSKELWKNAFGEHLKNYVITWEAKKMYSALQTLCKCWIEPLLKKHRDLLPYLQDCCDYESSIYLSHLLRIAAKLGLAVNIKKISHIDLLDHEEEIVRLNAFAVCCYKVSQHDNFGESVNAVKHFLYFNATADSTYLREGVINNFKTFFSNILRLASTKKDSAIAMPFIEWLYEFLIDCFEIGSCYQRKILGLQLYKVTMKFLSGDGPVSKEATFKEAAKYGPVLQTEMKNTGKWRFTDREIIVLLFKLILDPACDIKDISTEVIIEFFDDNVINDLEKNSLFVTALENCNSYKFFEADSGAHLFKILTHWYPLNRVDKKKLKVEVNSKAQCNVDNCDSYSRFLFEEAENQFILTKSDILKAATYNSPFYGIITALKMVAFSGEPESKFVTEQFLEDLLCLLDSAISFFLRAFSSKSSKLEYSSSFQEMGLAIDEAIKNSEISYEYDELVLSPAQQTICTCIWRSLKALCELLVKMAKSDRATASVIKRVGDLIFNVSLKCRHKGVIESAGVAIGDLTRYLCKEQKNVDLLEGYLNILIDNDFSTNINLTRRGAGLTILFHKIVASDSRTERPLLHHAVRSLIRSLNDSSERLSRVEKNWKSNCDDPRAMHLHFLKTLVADRQLQPVLSPYLEDICLTCFKHLPSEAYTIRNASFQLFGAIVSRLVGQNSGALSLDFGYGYSLNYFATHFPRLAAHLLLSLRCYNSHQQQQQQQQTNVKSQTNTDIIHVLSLLSKLYVGGCELVDGAECANFVRRIRDALLPLLRSPVHQVRDLAAKAYVAGVGLVDIDAEISHLKDRVLSFADRDLNRLNGCLLTLEYLHDKLDDELRSTSVRHKNIKYLSEVRRNLEIRAKTESVWGYWLKRCAIGVASEAKLCYVVEAQLVRLSRRFRISFAKVEESHPRQSTEAIIKVKPELSFEDLFDKTSPGFFEFVDELMSFYVEYAERNEDYAHLKSLLSSRCADFSVAFFKHAPVDNRHVLMRCVDFAVDNFERFSTFALESLNVYCNDCISESLRTRSLEMQYADVSRLKRFAAKLASGGDVAARTARMIELDTLVRILSLRGSGVYDLFEDLISNVVVVAEDRVKLEDYFFYPETLRLIVAKVLDVLLCNFDQLPSNCRVIPLLTALTLLRDEVDAIRESTHNSIATNVMLACKLSKERVMQDRAYSILMLNLVSEKSLLRDFDVDEVKEFFRNFLSTMTRSRAGTNNADIDNPFDDNYIPPYNEESKIINLVVFCVRQKACNGAFTKDKGVYDNISYNVFDVKHDLIKRMNVDLGNLQDVLNINYNEYLAKKLKIVIEIYLKKK